MQSNWRVPVVVNRKKSTLFTPKKGKKKYSFCVILSARNWPFFLSYVTCLLTHIYIFGLFTPHTQFYSLDSEAESWFCHIPGNSVSNSQILGLFQQETFQAK